MIPEVHASVAELVPSVSEHIQFLMLVLQGLLTVVLAGMGFVIKWSFDTLKEIQKELTRIDRALLSEYATKSELSTRVHGLRDQLYLHRLWFDLIAKACKVELPGIDMERRGRKDESGTSGGD